MITRFLTGAAIGLALTGTVLPTTSAAQTAATPAPAGPAQTASPAAPGQYVPVPTVPTELIAGPVTAADLPRLQGELKRVKARLDDWPAIGRYADANKTVTPPAAGEPRVVFLGDSITDSWDDPKFGGFFPGKPYINRGISGQTTPQMVLRMPADVLAHQPKAIVLLAGTNDIAGNTGPMTIAQIEDNITMICELATGRGIKVVLSSILPTSNYHYDGVDPRGPQTFRRPLEQIRTLNTWMQDYAAKNGHVYLDYWTATVDANGMLKTELSADDLHPNAAGYALMAPLAEAAIAKALASKGGSKGSSGR
jgi:lysophospholipase L1-like esterase